MGNENKYFLAMYDVRGIQKYIFRTPDLKSAIGASALVEDIIEKALRESVDSFEKQTKTILKKDYDWCDDAAGPKPYTEDAFDIQVLYIGGGNAFVVYRNWNPSTKGSGYEGSGACGQTLAAVINQKMSKYILEHTYALQLAVAMVEKTEDYQDDQKRVRCEMEFVKRSMSAATPFGATPAVKVDARTGYPLTMRSGKEELSTEAFNKKIAAEHKRCDYKEEEKRIDSLRTKKGVDSNIAVIHIDGNNLGLRIRNLLKDKKTYQDGVTAQREISYRINHAYKAVFADMKQYVEQTGKNHKRLQIKENNLFVIPIVTAGDDITYVCNGRMALKSVEFFARAISGFSMANQEGSGKKSSDEDPDNKYSFSICAGIAFANSHFPFHIAYSVAEECCENAKKTAKMEENLQDGMIGNWVDFHICKNVQARNLKAMREREYATSLGEQFLIRPYYIANGTEKENTVFGNLAGGTRALSNLEKNVDHFRTKIPRSFAKQLRNVYSLGRYETGYLGTFLQSRNHAMPDGGYEMYEGNRAKWYDALEIMELFSTSEGEAVNG